MSILTAAAAVVALFTTAFTPNVGLATAKASDELIYGTLLLVKVKRVLPPALNHVVRLAHHALEVVLGRIAWCLEDLGDEGVSLLGLLALRDGVAL